MSHRVVASVLCLLSDGTIVLGYFLLHPEIVGWCPSGLSGNCLGEAIAFGIGSPLYWSIRWLPLFFFALVFIQKDVFQAWWKFAIVFSILPLLFVIVSPPLSEMFDPGRTLVTERMVQLFVIASVLFIAWKYWRLSRIGQSR